MNITAVAAADNLLQLLGWISVFLFGLMVGSFLNVLIWRLPGEEQVIRGRSHCRSCGHVIPWYDNVPVLSFLLLKGRCRFCQAKISWIYPLVELVTGLLFVGIAARFGWTALTAVYAAVAASLVVVTVVDAREMIIPDAVTIPGLQLGVVLSFFLPALHQSDRQILSYLFGWQIDPRWESLIAAVLGALVGAGLLIIVGTIGSWVFKREAMGQGDVKLMAFVGSVIGAPKVLLVNFILAPLMGSVAGLVVIFRRKPKPLLNPEGPSLNPEGPGSPPVTSSTVIPYGPFLALGTLIALLWGDEMIHWYLRLIGL